MPEPKKTITIKVDAEIAEEFHTGLTDWVSDFYGEEASRITVGQLEDA